MERILNRITSLLLPILLCLAGCQPISSSNPPTGNVVGAAAGGAAGAATAIAFDATKPVTFAAGLAGASLGYYLTTLRFSSAEILHAGGKVFVQGEFVTIEVPSDYLFDVDSSEFNPGVDPVLDSIVSVLQRFPDNNIMISGNTSGTDSDHFELKLSNARARQVASYMWMKGIGYFNGKDYMPHRKLNYVGYGSFFPVANNLQLKSIRSNSRIQITSYPPEAKLHLNQCYKIYENIGAIDETKCPQQEAPPTNTLAKDFNEETVYAQNQFSSEVSAPRPSSRSDGYVPGVKGEFSDEPIVNHNNVDTVPTYYNTANSSDQINDGSNLEKQTGSSGPVDLKGAGAFNDASR